MAKRKRDVQVLFWVSAEELELIDLWLDEAIMEPSKKDDYLHVEAIVKKFGKKYVEDGYINERTLDKVLHNMRELYQKIRRE